MTRRIRRDLRGFARPWPLFLLSLLALSATIFLALAEDVWFREGFAWDAPIALAIHRLPQPWLDGAMETITWTGGPGALLGTLAASMWLLRRRRRARALLILGSYATAVAFTLALKQVFQRPRPALFPPLVVANGYSFPSGHTFAALILYGLLAAYLWQDGRRAPALLLVAWGPLIGLSRIYLGVHYPSDVLASLTVGALWILPGLALMRWRRSRQAAGPPSAPARDADGG